MVNGTRFRFLLIGQSIGLVAISLVIGATTNAVAQERAVHAEPTAVKASAESDKLADLRARLANQYPSIQSLALARGGCIEFEYYKHGVDAQDLSPVRSVTKSVLSILVGIAIDRGHLRLDQKISELLPEAANPAVDPRVRDITVRDLLTMTSGFDPAAFGARAGALPPSAMWQWPLYRHVRFPPGVQFFYDNDAVNLLSVVLARAIGQSSETFAEQNLFRPLGITAFKWTADGAGYLIGADGLLLTARDMVKIGALYLNGGRWADRQIVSRDYVADSIAKHNDGGFPTRAAYGYLWWLKPTKTGQDAFFASGKGSQLIYVVPKLDLVVEMASSSSVAGGSVSFVNGVVLPAAEVLPRPPTCAAYLEQPQ